MYQCPCCDYFTLGRRGEYDICRVCFWEDSGQDLDRLDDHSGPNHQTLRQARENFAQFGACDRTSLAHVLPPSKRTKYVREPRIVC
jgi:Cysteine-rich CPCC